MPFRRVFFEEGREAGKEEGGFYGGKKRWWEEWTASWEKGEEDSIILGFEIKARLVEVWMDVPLVFLCVFVGGYILLLPWSGT